MTFGPLPEPRFIPAFVRPQSAEELALQELRQRSAREAAARSELAAAQKQTDALAEKLALQVYKKRAAAKDPLVQSLQQLLRMEGITLVTYAGEELTEALETEADIVEWLPAGADPVARVADAIEPEIRRGGRLIHRAKLSCRMAAEQAAPEAAPASPEETPQVAPEAVPAAPEETPPHEPEAAPPAPEPVEPEPAPPAAPEAPPTPAAPEAPPTPEAPAEPQPPETPPPMPLPLRDAWKLFTAKGKHLRKAMKKAAEKAAKEAKTLIKSKKGS